MPYLISLGAGIAVGLLYYLVRVQSPAPPLIALAGLLGIVVGEHAIPFVQAQLRPAAAQVHDASAAGPTAETPSCKQGK
ncbi:XapX domain-containing protein [Burkholderia dolosa]|jgi:XapX domain-containing protein|uniref:DUF1427 family protein n=1 Tax=Burkholderia dolosa TaxID=152500 RepID=A0A892I7U1_9BURK|nr:MULTISPECIES: DUF1427 family protein [Burkholderia]AKE01807.1 XapX domain-containing protein [Burkholderia cepacia]AJY11133.1 XapX domain protein [Burkholderia dolosa AU0158]AYZ95775.1 DUF1427 family protein [Burkholderia dolosa]ETP61558.1 XapX domain-containing protein [Burkholderia dolosa PC543]MBR8302925.1 DUF1427 family protein [Burkholderia dolosa]